MSSAKSKHVKSLFQGQGYQSGVRYKPEFKAGDFEARDNAPAHIREAIQAAFIEADNNDLSIYQAIVNACLAIEQASSNAGNTAGKGKARRKTVSIEAVIDAQCELNSLDLCYEHGSHPTVKYNQSLLSANVFNQCGISFKALQDWLDNPENKVMLDNVNNELLQQAIDEKTISIDSVDAVNELGGLVTVMNQADIDDADKKAAKQQGKKWTDTPHQKARARIKKAFGITRAKAANEVIAINKAMRGAQGDEAVLIPVYVVDNCDGQVIRVNKPFGD
jgi:hypothetical protein